MEPAEITLGLEPQSRLDIIDVNERIAARFGDLLDRYRKAIYCSYHTTAGYFEERLCARFQYSREALRSFVTSVQSFFPPNADYRHDQLQLRTELSEEQKLCEPRNADSHLTFIGSGLSSCVTYPAASSRPAFFVDLDGVNGQMHRRRQTTVIGFDREQLVGEFEFLIPVSPHPIDSVNLKEARLGVFEVLGEVTRKFGILNGRVDISLDAGEQHTGLTVNEYETLLMKHDLTEVLANPLKYMAQKGWHMMGNPRAIPGKALNYAKYDLVRLVNEFIDAMGWNGSFAERVIDRFVAVPAARFLWMKRSLSLLISGHGKAGGSSIVTGPYQSPILVQWRRAEGRARRLRLKVFRFE